MSRFSHAATHGDDHGYDALTDGLAETDPWNGPTKRVDASRLAEARNGWIGSLSTRDPQDEPYAEEYEA